MSPDGIDIAVAGRRGLALYSRRSTRWRLFGDVSHEKELAVHALLWLPRMILVCATVTGSPASAQLLLFPRYHLDNASILARYPLDQIPLAIDVLGAAVAVATAPLDIKVLRVDLTGDLTPLGTPRASFVLIRELSIMSVGQPLQDIALVNLSASPSHRERQPGQSSGPQHCVLLRAGGLLSLLDMELGSEMTLAEDIECFWLSSPGDSPASSSMSDAQALADALDVATSLDPRPIKGEMRTPFSNSLPETPSSSANESPPRPALSPAELPLGPRPSSATSHAKQPKALQHAMSTESELHFRIDSGKAASTSGRQGAEDVEVPWWTYGARGMQLWFPSSLAESLSPRTQLSSRPIDPELEFDKEVYPIGISLAEVAIIGVTQRVLRNPGGTRLDSHARLPQFQVLPETQPVLPCLLRRLLFQGRQQEAFSLARRHAEAPHFARSLEWLLFTSLEINADVEQHPTTSMRGSAGEGSGTGPLLRAAAALLRRFPQFAEIVVSVARKTDAAMWGALFAAVGRPSRVLEELLEGGALQSSACCLVIVDRLEGQALAFALCQQLIKVTLAEGQYNLTAELIRFMVPPGEDSLLSSLPKPAGANGYSHGSAGSSSHQATSWLGSWFGRASTQQPPATGIMNGKIPEAVEGSEEEQAYWRTAWRAIGSHAWRLLDQGHLKAAARLGRALADVGGSLSALLLSCPEGRRDGIPSPAVCLSALAIVEQDFPIASSQESLSDAVLLREACHTANCHDWLVALALHLEDTAALAEMRHLQTAFWSAFAEAAAHDDRAQPYRDLIMAVKALPGSSPEQA